MKLNFKTFGSGEPLIILHGLMGSLDNWQTLAKSYAEHFTVFILDLRNHGKSPHSEAFSYQLMTDDLLAFCEQQFIFKTNIIGHSMGGKVAMQFALEHSDYVDRLIIADIAPVTYPPGHNEIFDALFKVNLRQLESRNEAEKIIAADIPDFGTRQFLLKGLTRDEDNNFVWKFNLTSLWNHYSNILSSYQTSERFDGKTLFIRGEKSQYVKDDYLVTIDQYFSNYQLETVSGAGHWLHAENPKEFLDLSLKFLLQ